MVTHAGQTALLNFRNGRQPLPDALQGQQLVSPRQSESANAALGYAPHKNTHSPSQGQNSTVSLGTGGNETSKGRSRRGDERSL